MTTIANETTQMRQPHDWEGEKAIAHRSDTVNAVMERGRMMEAPYYIESFFFANGEKVVEAWDIEPADYATFNRRIVSQMFMQPESLPRYKEWHPNGQLKFAGYLAKWELGARKQNLPCGGFGVKQPYNSWYDSGRPKAELAIRSVGVFERLKLWAKTGNSDFCQERTYRSYHENGVLASEEIALDTFAEAMGVYTYDQRSSIRKLWHENGQLAEVRDRGSNVVTKYTENGEALRYLITNNHKGEEKLVPITG